MTAAENLFPTGFRSPDRQVRSESLYRLRHPGPTCFAELATAMETESANSSKSLIVLYQNTRRHIPRYCNHNKPVRTLNLWEIFKHFTFLIGGRKVEIIQEISAFPILKTAGSNHACDTGYREHFVALFPARQHSTWLPHSNTHNFTKDSPLLRSSLLTFFSTPQTLNMSSLSLSKL